MVSTAAWPHSGQVILLSSFVFGSFMVLHQCYEKVIDTGFGKDDHPCECCQNGASEQPSFHMNQ